MLTNKTELQKYFAFEVTALDNRKIKVNSGCVYYHENSVTRHTVTGVVKTESELGTITTNGSGYIYVLLNHGSIADSSTVVSLNSCEITIDDEIDEDTQTLVKVASIEWANNYARITQLLHSDIYCSIMGTKL